MPHYKIYDDKTERYPTFSNKILTILLVRDFSESGSVKLILRKSVDGKYDSKKIRRLKEFKINKILRA